MPFPTIHHKTEYHYVHPVAFGEACRSGQWYTFDARHNVPRIGRILTGAGCDAADVALPRVSGEWIWSNSS